MHKLLHAIYNALRNMMHSSSSNPSSDSYEERHAKNAVLPSSATPMLAGSNPVRSVRQWPPPPPSPSTRPASSTPALFEAHLLRHEGCADHHYEDASAFNAYSGFAAVADGLTVSSRSDLFADSLVRHFVQGEFYLEKPDERKTWWKLCKREWDVQATRLFSGMSAEEQHQHAKGSGATFIGFWSDPKLGACLYSVGDCYGLWFDNDGFVASFPEVPSFNNSPTTVDSIQELTPERLVVSRFQSAEDMPGVLLVLCSDTLAEYFVTQKPWEHQPSFWQDVKAMDDQRFGEWAETRKAANELKDDDYTLLLLEFPQATNTRRDQQEVGAKAMFPAADATPVSQRSRPATTAEFLDKNSSESDCVDKVTREALAEQVKDARKNFID